MKASSVTSRTEPSVYVASTFICWVMSGMGTIGFLGKISIDATRGLSRSSFTPPEIQERIIS